MTVPNPAPVNFFALSYFHRNALFVEDARVLSLTNDTKSRSKTPSYAYFDVYLCIINNIRVI